MVALLFVFRVNFKNIATTALRIAVAAHVARMLVFISAAPSLLPRGPVTARRVFVGSGSGPATGRSKVLAGLQPRSRLVAMAESFVDDEVELMGQKVVARRFVEADVGMSFPKRPLHDQLFAREWPEKYPFPPEAFRRQDEQEGGGLNRPRPRPRTRALTRTRALS